MIKANNLKFILLSLLASSTFAIIAPFSIATEQAGMIPAYTVLYRYMVLILLSTPFIILYARQYFNFSRQHFWLIMLQSLGTCVLNLAYLGAMSYIPLSLAVIIFFIFPLITLLVTPFIFGGQLTLLKIIIFICAFIGLLLVIGPEFSTLNPIGIILALIGACAAVVQLLCMSKLMKELNAAALIYSVHFVAMLFTALILLSFYSVGQLSPPPDITINIALNFSGVVVFYTIAYGLFSYVARHLPPTTISLLANIEPVVTIAIAVLLFSEILQTTQQFGIAIVLVALVAGSLAKA